MEIKCDSVSSSSEILESSAKVRASLWKKKVFTKDVVEALSPILTHLRDFKIKQNEHGFSIIHIDVLGNDIESAERDIVIGEDVNMLSVIDKISLLQLAVSGGNYDMVKMLIAYDADLNYAADDGKNNPPLFIAIAKGDLAMVKLLLLAGVNVNKEYTVAEHRINSWAFALISHTSKQMEIISLLEENGAKRLISNNKERVIKDKGDNIKDNIQCLDSKAGEDERKDPVNAALINSELNNNNENCHKKNEV